MNNISYILELQTKTEREGARKRESENEGERERGRAREKFTKNKLKKENVGGISYVNISLGFLPK